MIWVEKYRPSSFDDIIMPEKNKIEALINNSTTMPHFLFYGKAGIGKTTLAKIIIKKLECSYLILNASD